MPDISMCANHDCPLRHKCYRHEAEPTPLRQSYAHFEPYERPLGARSTETVCDSFIPIRKRGEKRNVTGNGKTNR